MENLPSIDSILAAASQWMSHLMAFELPVPDAALILAFLLAAYAMRLSHRGATDQSRAEVENLYQAELLLANRRTHQAQGELRKAHLELERERQKRRREHGRSDAARRRMIAAKLVKTPDRAPAPLHSNTQTKLEHTS
ncbi:hypothetical protein SLH49_02530 [Cognatiyoonia sp. IB215446]|uniref:hypothetical protein n=1 Tax=Cognatiyoonia sp. IB215446 TaxID=3097355 RepID=UPI002A14AA08|nr:hypothetical protein [Cognatiyoonia sp. IB215446]MDX8346852.1 hypothetical protein [Cognatiyoonia sp. IB215446]